MNKGNIYYLIARNKKDNTVNVIPINNCEGNKLENIDLYTINFNNEEELSMDLLSRGLITSIPVDLFIANQTKGVVNIQEVIYSYAKEIRSIAENSCNSCIDKSHEEIDTILDSFASMMEHNTSFYNTVMFTDTNIYRKYIDYFEGENLSGTVKYNIKYKGNSWGRKSYKLIRNIVETINRFRNYKLSNHKMNKNKFYRSMLMSKLIELTDKNFVPNQMGLLDSFDLDDDTKLLEIISTFDRVDIDDFLLDKDQISINYSNFNNVLEEDKIKLNMLLPKEFISLLYKMSRANNSFQTELYEAFRDSIVNMLDNDTNLLNAAYDWISLYNKYKNSEFGDVDGFQYRK